MTTADPPSGGLPTPEPGDPDRRDAGVAFSRSAGQVLDIVYLNSASVKQAGFLPKDVNGEINTSGATTRPQR